MCGARDARGFITIECISSNYSMKQMIERLRLRCGEGFWSDREPESEINWSYVENYYWSDKNLNQQLDLHCPEEVIEFEGGINQSTDRWRIEEKSRHISNIKEQRKLYESLEAMLFGGIMWLKYLQKDWLFLYLRNFIGSCEWWHRTTEFETNLCQNVCIV